MPSGDSVITWQSPGISSVCIIERGGLNMQKTKKLTQEDKERIAGLYKYGLSIKKIAQACDLSKGTVIRAIKSTVGLRTAEERFWLKVEKWSDGCENFIGATDKDGYGRASYRGKPIPAHRLAWQLRHGEIPEGMCVLHTCNRPNCVADEHLYLGTRADNQKYMVEQGRSSSGRKRRRLTPEAVVAIRKLKSEGVSRGTLAACYEVSRKTIDDLLAGRTWRNIEA